MERAMSQSDFGDLIQPRHCRVSVSPDKTKLALTFRSEDRSPVTVVVPMAGAMGLQRQLAQGLYLLGARPAVGPAAAAVSAEAAAPAETAG